MFFLRIELFRAGVVFLALHHRVQVLETLIHDLFNRLILGFFVEISGHENRQVRVIVFKIVLDLVRLLHPCCHVFLFRFQVRLGVDESEAGILGQLEEAMH